MAGVGIGADTDAVVLDCYWLAQWYHQSPEVFLAMPLSQVQLHVKRTDQIRALRAAARDDNDGN